MWSMRRAAVGFYGQDDTSEHQVEATISATDNTLVFYLNYEHFDTKFAALDLQV